MPFLYGSFFFFNSNIKITVENISNPRMSFHIFCIWSGHKMLTLDLCSVKECPVDGSA